MKLNKRTLLRIHKTGDDEYAYIFMYKIVHFKKDTVLRVTKYGSKSETNTWHTGRVIWKKEGFPKDTILKSIIVGEIYLND